MSWYEDLLGSDDDDIGKKSGTTTTPASEDTSWFNKIGWDDVGESLESLFGDDDDKSGNANTRQQPNQTVKDDNGNAVTGAALQGKDNRLLYVGGGIAALVAVFGLILVIKK